MARTYRLSVGPHETDLRLDQYLVRRLPSALSRSLIQRLVREGSVTVEGQPAKAHRRLRRGETVCAHIALLPAPPVSRPMEAEPIPLDVVYEDGELLVVNKPPGLVTHPAPGHWSGTLVNAILWHFENAQGSGLRAVGKGPEPRAQSPEPQLPRAGIVHRLDKDTSGLLLVAKTALAHTSLARQLKARTMSRRYVALVEGHVPLDEGTISASLGRHLTRRKEMTVRHLGGRSALTHYRVVRRYGRALRVRPACRAEDSPKRRGAGRGSGLGVPAQSPEPRAQSDLPYTLLDVSLGTGRTHQIRVHLAHLGYPVMGDTTYGKRPASFWQSHGVPRQLLHAYAMRFRHPATHQPVELTAPTPEDIQRWISGQ